MPIEPSTPEQLRQCERYVRAKELKIKRLVAAGKKVHVIWDVDSVLVNGRGDDSFGLLGFDVKKYFTLEERLVTQALEDGPWASLARKCGEPGYQQSQDIVTARSSFLALRVMFFLLNGFTEGQIRWQLFVGHQPKAESYRIILKSFEKDPDTHVICVDDAKKHVDAFVAVAAELGMSARCHGINAPTVRTYDEAELRREIDAVMNPQSDRPFIVEVKRREPGTYGRYICATPDPRQTIRSMWWYAFSDMDRKATVDRHRETLESFADDVTPGQEKTDDHLYFLFDLLREPGGGR
jgi:hypothetical protein